MSFIFSTVGSPISTPKKPGSTIGTIQQMAALGLSTLELGWVQSIRTSEETCRAIKQIANENKISISVHAANFINLNADDNEWPKYRKRLLNASYFGALAGATDVIIHPGSYFNQPQQEDLERLASRLSGCVQEHTDFSSPCMIKIAVEESCAKAQSWKKMH